jgi:aminopeptidase N
MGVSGKVLPQGEPPVRIALIALLFSLPSHASPLRPAEDNLPNTLAVSRFEQIRTVAYHLAFTFTSGKDEYAGKAEIETDLAELNRPLSLDWKGRKPDSIMVNGAPITDYTVQTGSLTIPAKHLAKNSKIEISFTNDFSKEGNGIQRVVDPEDKQEYVYSDFEPYEAHQLFPCFDQPNLKAHFDLSVTAPKEWKVIANELVADSRIEGDTQTTKFKTTPLLSTYLFFVGAGPFQEWNDKEGTIPLEIYSRKSLAKYMDTDRLFTTIKKGLRFYRGFFDFEYPFAKFALVFVPEFGPGAMENPGAVTMNERMIYRGPVPATRLEARDSTILHEMAHHWFGDLVTMKWWNDLWLNESFATYMSALTLDRAFESKTVWEDFSSEKSWGYWQDQLVTTHPIETKVPDTRTARGNFDGITYAKGAATLQQLHFFVGEDAFRDGIRAYFRAHAFGNAERADFVNAIAQAGRLNLSAWTHDWLQTAGINRVSSKWICAQKTPGNETLESLDILQERSSSGTLSPHRTRLGFYRKGKDGLELIRSQDMAYSKASNAAAIEPTACPDFVFPNLDDKDYALFSLDKQSIQSAASILEGGIRYPLLRLQTWGVLGQMVRDGKLSPLEYFPMALKGLKNENDEGVLATIISRYSPLLGMYHQYLTPTERSHLASEFEQVVLDRLGSADKGGDRQMMFFDFFLSLAQTPASLDKIAGWLEKNNPPDGIQLDQDRRWSALLTLARNGYSRAQVLVEAEEKKDSSDIGKRMAYAARVALPDATQKTAFWSALEHPEKIPPSTLRSAAYEFHQPNFQQLSADYVKRFFERIKKIDWKKSDFLVHVYFDGLFPEDLCSSSLLQKSESALHSEKGLTDLARRSWLEANDELRRCVKVRLTEK